MPSGYPNKTVIDIEASTRSGLRGRLDRLAQQLAFDAQAVRRTLELIDEDDRQTALTAFPRKMIQAINGTHTARYVQAAIEAQQPPEPVTKKKRRKSGKRKSQAERIEEIRAYITAHPGQNTKEIADGLGWRANQVHKFAHLVATPESQGPKKHSQWFITTGKKTSSRKNTKPRGERQEEIRRFLTRHPQAYTAKIAAAMGLKNNSGFKTLLREVAKPVGPTNATQPIQWVLT